MGGVFARGHIINVHLAFGLDIDLVRRCKAAIVRGVKRGCVDLGVVHVVGGEGDSGWGRIEIE